MAEVTITLTRDETSGITVHGRFQNLNNFGKEQVISFPTRFEGIALPEDRVSGIRLTGPDGSNVNYRKLIPGEYLAEDDFNEFAYQVSLPIPNDNRAPAHVSWIGNTNGLLMLSDLLPLIGGRKFPLKLKVNLPEGWEVHSSEKLVADKAFAVEDLDRAVFLIGTGLRKYGKDQIGKDSDFEMAFSGEWLFSDTEAAGMVSEIAGHYKKILGLVAGPFRVNILKFPGNAGPGNWEAETRGSTVTIVSSDMPFRSQSLQRIHEQLRHELFHLWIPNGLRLQGKYDWFYEGFTLYMSLKAGVMTNQIRFADFLDTLSRAKNIASRSTQGISLIAESKNQLSGSETHLYARGMAAAFLADVRLMAASGGKKSIENVYRRLFETYRLPGPETDGSEAVLEIMRTNAELIPVIEKYISGADQLEWRQDLIAAGIEETGENGRSLLRETAKPAGLQKTILNKLGYNNWRKLSPIKK